MTASQMLAVASVADRYGSGTIRLTVWQNLLISDIPTDKLEAAKRELEAASIGWSATSVRAGLVACTGNAGCKFAASNTKKHATQIANYLEQRLELDQPINIHLTGCPHSCAQHYIGDIGLLATKVTVGEDMVEGYHLFVGGGYGIEQNIGREIRRDIVAEEVPMVLERVLRSYLENRNGRESFREFVSRLPIEQLKGIFDQEMVAA